MKITQDTITAEDILNIFSLVELPDFVSGKPEINDYEKSKYGTRATIKIDEFELELITSSNRIRVYTNSSCICHRYCNTTIPYSVFTSKATQKKVSERLSAILKQIKFAESFDKNDFFKIREITSEYCLLDLQYSQKTLIWGTHSFKYTFETSTFEIIFKHGYSVRVSNNLSMKDFIDKLTAEYNRLMRKAKKFSPQLDSIWKEVYQ